MMKYTCANPNCTRQDHQVDEVEFMQFRCLLSTERCRAFDDSGLCPECFIAQSHLKNQLKEIEISQT